ENRHFSPQNLSNSGQLRKNRVDPTTPVVAPCEMKAARERQEVLMIRKIVSLNWLLSVFFLSLYPIAIAQTPSSPQPPQPLPQNTSGPVSSPAPPGSDEDLSYRIGPGDELDVRVFGRAELSRVVRVDNYGNIRLPFLNEMKAACYSEAQL